MPLLPASASWGRSRPERGNGLFPTSLPQHTHPKGPGDDTLTPAVPTPPRLDAGWGLRSPYSTRFPPLGLKWRKLEEREGRPYEGESWRRKWSEMKTFRCSYRELGSGRKCLESGNLDASPSNSIDKLLALGMSLHLSDR